MCYHQCARPISLLFILILFFLRQGRVTQCTLSLKSLNCPGWPCTCDLPVSASRLLGWRVCPYLSVSVLVSCLVLLLRVGPRARTRYHSPQGAVSETGHEETQGSVLLRSQPRGPMAQPWPRCPPWLPEEAKFLDSEVRSLLRHLASGLSSLGTHVQSLCRGGQACKSIARCWNSAWQQLHSSSSSNRAERRSALATSATFTCGERHTKGEEGLGGTLELAFLEKHEV